MIDEPQSAAFGWRQEAPNPIDSIGGKSAESNASVSDLNPSNPPASHSCVPPWLLEASNPYWEWLWGGSEEALTQLAHWYSRPGSELSERRIVYLHEGDGVLGGYIALSGAELQVCRKADLVALTAFLRRRPGGGLMARLRQSRSLFASVADDEFYLSRVGVDASARGRGAGRRLLEMFLQNGQSRGFKRFRLDVSIANTSAIRLYSGMGFQVTSETAISETDIRYSSMLASFP